MKMKRTIAFMIVVVLLIANAYSVGAVGVIGEMITDISGMNQLSISAAINDYFASREAFLSNQADTINVPLSGVVEDEAAHKQRYELVGVFFINSVISVGDIVFSDTQADAEVVETITYTKDGVIVSATVEHKLFLVLNDENVPVVVSDRYYEDFSAFKSCSYVDETAAYDTNAYGGSGSCISRVAWNEIGTTEDANGCTKYGQWYGEPDWNWCAIFVSWCANKANIATSIIPETADPDTLKDSTIFYSRNDAVDSNAPKTGDLIFFSWRGTGVDHVGIVYSTSADSILVVHGNNSANAVDDWNVSRTDAQIMGYGKPAYASSSHSSSYHSNSTSHWRECDNCGYQYSATNASHTFVRASNETQHWYQCEVCAYKKEFTNHTFTTTYSTTSIKHWRYCTTCFHKTEYESHSAGTSYSKDASNHWKDCKKCGYDMNVEGHTMSQSGIGGAYKCSKCGYTTNTPIMSLGTMYMPYCISAVNRG